MRVTCPAPSELRLALTDPQGRYAPIATTGAEQGKTVVLFQQLRKVGNEGNAFLQSKRRAPLGQKAGQGVVRRDVERLSSGINVSQKIGDSGRQRDSIDRLEAAHILLIHDAKARLFLALHELDGTVAVDPLAFYDEGKRSIAFRQFRLIRPRRKRGCFVLQRFQLLAESALRHPGNARIPFCNEIGNLAFKFHFQQVKDDGKPLLRYAHH